MANQFPNTPSISLQKADIPNEHGFDLNITTHYGVIIPAIVQRGDDGCHSLYTYRRGVVGEKIEIATVWGWTREVSIDNEI